MALLLLIILRPYKSAAENALTAASMVIVIGTVVTSMLAASKSSSQSTIDVLSAVTFTSTVVLLAVILYRQKIAQAAKKRILKRARVREMLGRMGIIPKTLPLTYKTLDSTGSPSVTAVRRFVTDKFKQSPDSEKRTGISTPVSVVVLKDGGKFAVVPRLKKGTESMYALKARRPQVMRSASSTGDMPASSHRSSAGDVRPRTLGDSGIDVPSLETLEINGMRRSGSDKSTSRQSTARSESISGSFYEHGKLAELPLSTASLPGVIDVAETVTPRLGDKDSLPGTAGADHTTPFRSASGRTASTVPSSEHLTVPGSEHLTLDGSDISAHFTAHEESADTFNEDLIDVNSGLPGGLAATLLARRVSTATEGFSPRSMAGTVSDAPSIISATGVDKPVIPRDRFPEAVLDRSISSEYRTRPNIDIVLGVAPASAGETSSPSLELSRTGSGGTAATVPVSVVLTASTAPGGTGTARTAGGRLGSKDRAADHIVGDMMSGRTVAASSIATVPARLDTTQGASPYVPSIPSAKSVAAARLRRSSVLKVVQEKSTGATPRSLCGTVSDAASVISASRVDGPVVLRDRFSESVLDMSVSSEHVSVAVPQRPPVAVPPHPAVTLLETSHETLPSVAGTVSTAPHGLAAETASAFASEELAGANDVTVAPSSVPGSLATAVSSCASSVASAATASTIVKSSTGSVAFSAASRRVDVHRQALGVDALTAEVMSEVRTVPLCTRCHSFLQHR
jgi:hypothetical protein